MLADFVNAVIETMFLVLLDAVELIGYMLMGLGILSLTYFIIIYPLLRWHIRKLKG